MNQIYCAPLTEINTTVIDFQIEIIKLKYKRKKIFNQEKQEKKERERDQSRPKAKKIFSQLCFHTICLFIY